MKIKLDMLDYDSTTTVESGFFEHSIFRTTRFFKLWHVSLGFASVKHCNFTPDVSKLSLFRTNSYLPWKKFIRNLSSISQTLRKVLLSSFYLNGYTLGFYSQAQKLDPPSITQKTVPKKDAFSTFHLNGHFVGLAFLLVLFIMCTRWF